MTEQRESLTAGEAVTLPLEPPPVEVSTAPAALPPKEKRAHFFRLRLVSEGTFPTASPAVDWASKLEDLQDAGLIPFGIDVPYEGAARASGTVILGRRVDLNNFRRRTAEERFAPVEGDTAESYLARVNIGAFYSFNAFAILGASREAPGAPAMVDLANYLDRREGARWEAEPITADADLERFRGTRSLRKISFGATVSPAGLIEEPKGFAEHLVSAAEVIGSEVEVKVELTVKAPSAHQASTRALKKVAENVRDAFRPHKFEAHPAAGEFSKELIHLTSYALATSVLLPGGLAPDDMCTELARACAAMEARVQELVNRAEQQ